MCFDFGSRTADIEPAVHRAHVDLHAIGHAHRDQERLPLLRIDDQRRRLELEPPRDLAQCRDPHDAASPVTVGHVDADRGRAAGWNADPARARGARLPARRRNLAARRAARGRRAGQRFRHPGGRVQQCRDRVAERACARVAVRACHPVPPANAVRVS